MKKLKLFALALVALCTTTTWAATVTFTGTEFKSEKTVTKENITMTLAEGISNASEQQIYKDGTATKADVVQIGNSANADYTVYYVEISATTEITDVVVTAVNNQSSSTYQIPVVYWEGAAAAEFDGYEMISLNCKAETTAPDPIDLSPIAGTKTVRFYRTIRINAAENAFSGASGYLTKGDGKTAFIISVEVTAKASCESPATALSLTADKTSDVYVGDVITFTTEGGNGGTIKLYDGDTEITSPWTATEGEHSFTAVQENNTVSDVVYCGATTDAIVLNVAKAETVESAVIKLGDATGAATVDKNTDITLTCVAENATAWQWYEGGAEIDGATEATYSFRPTVPGTYSYTVKASNKFGNATSEPFALTVNDIPEVLVLWAKEEANRIGIITYGSEKISTSTVKIHNNSYTIDAIKIESSYSAADKHYVIIKPETGGFEEGDTVYVATCFNNSSDDKTAKIAIYSEDGETNLFISENNGVNGKNSADDPVVEKYVLTADADSLFLGRNGNTATFLSTLKVVRPVNDGVAKLSSSLAELELALTPDLASLSKTVKLSGKNLTPGTYDLSLTAVEGLSIDPTSVTVGQDGKLSQTVTVTFASDVDVAAGAATLALTIGEKSVSVTINFSAVKSRDYSSSINIEQLVLDYGTSYDIATALEEKNIEYASLNALDSLSQKDGRNEPYLGLKIKTTGGYLKVSLKKDDVLKVKFGNIGDPLNITIEGEEPVQHSEGIFTYTATEADKYVTIATSTKNTVVFKQIMINEDIAEVTLPVEKFTITCSDAENGSVTADLAEAAEGETVTLTVTPADGYKVESVKVNGSAIEPVQGVYSFTMPAAAVIVAATFVLDQPTAWEGINADGKAVKVIRDGQVLILRDNKTYNVIGTEVK